MDLKAIIISISDDQDLTDDQLDELLDLIDARLYRIRLEETIQQATSEAKLSQGVKIHVNY